MSLIELSEQEIQRRESLQKLRDLGIDPYPAALFPVNSSAKEIKNDFEDGKPSRKNLSRWWAKTHRKGARQRQNECPRTGSQFN